MRLFEDFISRWELVDVPLSGRVFTWFRGGENMAARRLDRILISSEIACQFPQLMQITLPRSISDHKPVILKEVTLKTRYRPFKWFSHWVEDAELFGLVKNLCENNQGNGVDHVLRMVKSVTKEWAKAIQEEDHESVQKIEEKIDSLENFCLSNGNNGVVQSEIYALKAKLWASLRREEPEWLQKSRLRWFKDGDKNTNFFHLTAATGGRMNQNFRTQGRELGIKETERHSTSLCQFLPKKLQ
ncbi:uncharacterized protein LOC120120406 [Hibiscus syriacus]|uniref:uncharacterized protein LOC120120406 n=1 Tax=Hibiscus syriacus TaxID=106335 RepID=UPI0019245C72|nr:uncharacterized protein LOC120120406 [Hibiscus syriacus]